MKVNYQFHMQVVLFPRKQFRLLGDFKSSEAL